MYLWILFAIVAVIIYTIVLKPLGILLKYKLKHGKSIDVYYFPIIGKLHHFYKQLRLHNDILYAKKWLPTLHPEVELQLANGFGTDFVFQFFTPEHTKFIMQNHHLYRKQNLEFQHLFATKGLFYQYGDDWKASRKFLSKHFEFNELIQSFPTIKQECIEYLSQIDGITDIVQVCGNIAGEVITKTYFSGALCGQMLNGNTFTQEVSQVIQDLMGFDRMGNQLVMLRKKLFKIPPNWALSKKEKNTVKRMDDINNAIKQAIVIRQSQDIKDKDLLSAYVEELKINPTITVENVIHQYLILLFAGMDTTSHLCGAACYVLAKYPEIQHKLREAVREQCKDFDQFTEKQLNSIPYLNSFINETLRMHSPAPSPVMRTTAEAHYVGPYFVPKNVEVVLSFVQNNYNPIVYPNPFEFKPERWMEDKQITHPFQYIPFSAGPRNCIGQHLSLMEIKCMLVYLILNYNITLNSEITWTFKFVYTMRENNFVKFQKL